MASTYFVHGNAVTPQSPGGGALGSPGDLEQVNGIGWTDVVGLREGPGTTFRGKQNPHNKVWFHIPFPTPTIVNDQQSILTSLTLFFDIPARGATVESVYLYGNVGNPHPWFQRDELGWSEGGTLDIPAPGTLLGVIGISIGVKFVTAANITFHGAMIQLA